ncbi:hypothetical protein BD311DRAFT_689099 [Dichomitus squalens]|uniref:CDR ABC transporter domain-containing protein n=1 Tax=Dichomitus squalens TaxID=114155 RepID=A0A4Q9MUA9_9APHY|nr:hypothetical protein BD311DRAFT_689099 [Dichomitus squalens]
MKLDLSTWFLWIMLFVQLVYAQPPIKPSNERNGTNLVCFPFGTCEPCPEDALHEPFCQPFGNRRLMHCVPVSTAGGPPTSVTHIHSPTETIRGEIPAWESCGRIVEQERADFYEFFACNLFIAIIAITVVLARSKRLQAIQARQLAARIGLVRSVPGGWSSS